jgi:hypothetical protein
MNQDPLDPKSDYVVPKGDTKYLKFEKGETEFMPLASAIVGFEYWNTEEKPVRSEEEFKGVPDDIRKDKDGTPSKIKAFWAFPVWDFSSKSVKVLQITQKTIMTAIRNYTKNAKWGSPIMKYSFTVTREGDGFDTEYSIMANPTEPTIDYAVTEAWEQAIENGFDITRLYDGGDPFTAEKK